MPNNGWFISWNQALTLCVMDLKLEVQKEILQTNA